MILTFLNTSFQPTETDVSAAVESVNSIILEAAKMSLKIRHGKCRKRHVLVNNKKWFDRV